MGLRLELTELGLPALDALDVDAVAVFVGPERPLQGLSGYVDWRLCGALSRAIRAGHFGAEPGEALLLPSDGRLSPSRIFCFGVGEAPLTSDAFLSACRQVCDALQRAGSSSFATALPPIQATPDAAVRVARHWVEACSAFRGKKVVLLGDPRALHRDLAAAKQSLGSDVDLTAPQSRVELPHRGPALPPRNAVIR